MNKRYEPKGTLTVVKYVLKFRQRAISRAGIHAPRPLEFQEV